jgi:hypothetical protein
MSVRDVNDRYLAELRAFLEPPPREPALPIDLVLALGVAAACVLATAAWLVLA